MTASADHAHVTHRGRVNRLRFQGAPAPRGRNGTSRSRSQNGQRTFRPAATPRTSTSLPHSGQANVPSMLQVSPLWTVVALVAMLGISPSTLSLAARHWEGD